MDSAEPMRPRYANAAAETKEEEMEINHRIPCLWLDQIDAQQFRFGNQHVFPLNYEPERISQSDID